MNLKTGDLVRAKRHIRGTAVGADGMVDLLPEGWTAYVVRIREFAWGDPELDLARSRDGAALWKSVPPHHVERV